MSGENEFEPQELEAKKQAKKKRNISMMRKIQALGRCAHPNEDKFKHALDDNGEYIVGVKIEDDPKLHPNTKEFFSLHREKLDRGEAIYADLANYRPSAEALRQA